MHELHEGYRTGTLSALRGDRAMLHAFRAERAQLHEDLAGLKGAVAATGADVAARLREVEAAARARVAALEAECAAQKRRLAAQDQARQDFAEHFHTLDL